jgi:DNA-directed RNA polymerase subunit H
VTEKELPKILLTDPALKNLDAKLGDVAKITRKSQTAGYATYYRIVVGK